MADDPLGPHQAMAALESALEADGGKHLIQPGCGVVLAHGGMFNLAEDYETVQRKREESGMVELTALVPVGPHCEWSTPSRMSVESKAIMVVLECTDIMWSHTVAEMKANRQGHALAVAGAVPGMRMPGA